MPVIVQPSPSPTPLASITPSPTPQPPSSTPLPSIVPSPIASPSVIPLPEPTDMPEPTSTPTPSPSPTAIPTVTPSATPAPTVIPTSIPSPSPEPSASPSATPVPSATPQPSAIPSPSLSPSPTASASATPSPSPTPTPTDLIGNDISYPQCNKNYPTGHFFGIVGVNGGIASTSNPCLASQLQWAASSLDSIVNQAKIQLYVNTGNPGGLNTPTWPQNNTDPQGNQTSNPHGTCDGSNSKACAWQYGWNRAVDDVINRFVPAANQAGISADPSKYPWWLDVETANSWREGSGEDLEANAATLEAMHAYFKSQNIKLGLYSTSFQWNKIVGGLSPQSSLHGLPNWIPGASTLDGAKSNCQKSPFTSGGSQVTMTQFTTGEFDYDYSCI